MKGFWKDAKGKLHKIEEMPKPYLLNCLKCLRRSMEQLVDAIGNDAMSCPEYLEMAEKYLELVNEYFKRLGISRGDIKLPAGVMELEQADLKEEEDKEFWKIVKGGGF